MTSLDYLSHLETESDRFAELLAETDLLQPVPSCPDWTAGDLFWHLTETQWMWGTVVRERLDGPPDATRRPARPTDLDSLCHLFATVSTELHDALEETPSDTPVWTWAPDKTAGFVRRRQTHEALVHRVDAELATGQPSPLDPGLASDGVDEVLRIMFGGFPAWGSWTLDGRSATVEATDTDASWGLVFGRFTGTDPDDGTQHDLDGFDVTDRRRDPAGNADLTVRGTAADLDCWLWGRLAADQVDHSGDSGLWERMQAIVAQGID